jgi:hypothetical protein
VGRGGQGRAAAVRRCHQPRRTTQPLPPAVLCRCGQTPNERVRCRVVRVVRSMQGANLMGKLLWTQAYRQEVWDSRINTNKAIVQSHTHTRHTHTAPTAHAPHRTHRTHRTRNL